MYPTRSHPSSSLTTSLFGRAGFCSVSLRFATTAFAMWLAGSGFPAFRVLLLKKGGPGHIRRLVFTFGEIYLLCFLVGGLLILLSDNAYIFSS